MTASPGFGGRLKNMNCSCFDYGIELYLGKGAPMHGPDYGMEIYLGEVAPMVQMMARESIFGRKISWSGL